jgi:hypothetical protein
MARSALLPKPKEFEKLTDAQTQIVMSTIRDANNNDLAYAQLTAVCGFLSLMGCIGTFAYLIETGHPQAAGTVVATGVLGIVGQFIKSRL